MNYFLLNWSSNIFVFLVRCKKRTKIVCKLFDENLEDKVYTVARKERLILSGLSAIVISRNYISLSILLRSIDFRVDAFHYSVAYITNQRHAISLLLLELKILVFLILSGRLIESSTD